MENKRCFFIGAKKIKKGKEKALKEKLNGIINGLIEEGIKEFYFVIDVGFETLAAKCVAEAKAKNEDIVLYIKVLVTEDMANSLNLEDIKAVSLAADIISPYDYSYNDPEGNWVYALYIHNVDVIVVYREKRGKILKNKRINDILEDYVRPKTRIIEVKV